MTDNNSQVSSLWTFLLALFLDTKELSNLFVLLLFIQPKRRSLFGDASKDITKSLAKKFDSSSSSTLGRRPVEDSSSLKRSSSIRTTDKPRSSFYTPTPESTSTIPERTMTLGRASSVRVNNRTPTSSTAAPAVVTTPDKKSSSSGYTTSLMNWRPFRKSRDETSDTGGSSSRKTSLTGGGSSISATLGRPSTHSTASSSRTVPLSSNTLGASNSSLKRSTSSVASTVPNKSAHSSSTNVQLLPTQRTSNMPSTSNFLSRSNSVRTPSAAPARTSVKGMLTN
jgi:hypothetical protein